MHSNGRLLDWETITMLKKTVFLGLTVLALASFSKDTEAQQIIKTLQDYCSNPYRQFQPDDPWTRSKIWNLQAGRSGLFFNCDAEEEKRYSPYIDWKRQTIDPIPPSPFCPRYVLSDCRALKQRVIDGSCGVRCTASQGPTSCLCPSGCNDCTTQKAVPTGPVEVISKSDPISPTSEPDAIVDPVPVTQKSRADFSRQFVAREGLISVRQILRQQDQVDQLEVPQPLGPLRQVTTPNAELNQPAGGRARR